MKKQGIARQLFEEVINILDSEYTVEENSLTVLTVYLVNLSPLHLRFTSSTPIIQVTTDDIDKFGEENIISFVRQEIYGRQEAPGSIIVFVEGNSRFLNVFSNDPFWAAIIDDEALQKIIDHPNPKYAFTNSLLARIPLRFLSPYDPNQPATDSLFYGRSSELNLILQHPKRSFAIEGGRRIGKTSLLREAKKVLLNQILPKEQYKRVVWYDFWGYKGEEPFSRMLLDTLERVSQSS
jgi:hypothetical protein